MASRLATDKIVGLDKRRLEHPLQRELTAAVADANAVIEFVVADNVTAIVADVVPRTRARDGWLDYLPAADTLPRVRRAARARRDCPRGR